MASYPLPRSTSSITAPEATDTETFELEEPVPSEAEVVAPGSATMVGERIRNKSESKDEELVHNGLSTRDYDPVSFVDEFDPINVANAVIQKNYEPRYEGKVVLPTDLWDMILNEKVPMSLSAVIIAGLPYCGKSSFLEQLLVNRVKLQSKSSHSKFDVKELINKTKKANGLSSFTLGVVGGQAYDGFAWALTSRRFGITYSAIAGLIRRLKSEKATLKKIKFQEDGLPVCDGNEQLKTHFKWVYDHVNHLITSSESGISNDLERQKLLAGGFSLVNVFDVGVNKAVYDFLPFLANYSDNLIRLVFFSMERDSTQLSKPPSLKYERYHSRGDDRLVMHWRPCMNYLMHFASLGFQPDLEETEGTSVFIGTWAKEKGRPGQQSSDFKAAKEKIHSEAKIKRNIHWTREDHWIELCLGQKESLESAGTIIEEVITKKSEFKHYVPVKWMFLRSFLSSKINGPIILTIKEIKRFASLLHIYDEEFRNFLNTFVNYGSLLYFQDFPSLRPYVIADVHKFTIFLSRLYYPESSNNDALEVELHQKYGILKKAYTHRLLSGQFPEAFMKIVTELGMAVRVEESNIEIDAESPIEDSYCYFLPSARVRDYSEPDCTLSSVYLRIHSTQFPANVQTNLATALINSKDMILIPCEMANVIIFESRDHMVRLEVSYFGEITELKLVKWNEQDTSGAVKIALGILEACCIAMNKRQQQIREMDFNVSIKCVAEGNTIYHDLFHQNDGHLCENCQGYCRNKEREIWLNAAKECQYLHEEQVIRMNRAVPLSLEECISIAKSLEMENNVRIKELAYKLGVEAEFSDLIEEHGNLQDWRLLIKLIFLWEEKLKRESPTNKLPSKHKLVAIFNELNVCIDFCQKMSQLFVTES